jgi:peptidoglycan hydrolase-like protein with peptidoglycan-binding domain
MKILKAGSSGATVRQWQTFLRGQGLTVNVNGSFDAATEEATRAFQVRNKLGVDGAVGNEIFGRAALLRVRTRADRASPRLLSGRAFLAARRDAFRGGAGLKAVPTCFLERMAAATRV